MVFCKDCSHFDMDCQNSACFEECNDPIYGKETIRMYGCYTLNKDCDCKYFEPITEHKPWWNFWVK